MNKVILLGRLTRDPEVRYSQGAEPIAVVRYTLAVNRRFKRDGEPDADFINCVAFGKTGEFAEKYYRKGQLVSVIGRLQVRSWDNKEGQKQWSTEVVIEDQYFAESKNASSGNAGANNYQQGAQYESKPQSASSEEFFAIDESLEDEDLPF